MKNLVYVLLIVGCSASKPAAEAAYTEQQIACVASASSRAAADACREAVRSKWGVDGGVK